VFLKTLLNFRKGHGSKTYATPRNQKHPTDIICEKRFCLAQVSQIGMVSLKKKETVVKKFDSFSPLSVPVLHV
jgi:hypothetical protein